MFELRAVERPYPGLRAFEPHEAEIFFGREAHTDRLLGILQRERFLAVIGPSGSGKSSLVRAGLLPGLAMGSLGTGSDWRIALLRPGDRPMRSLAAALLQPEVLGRHLLSHDGEPDAADIAALEAELRRGPLALATLCAEAQRRHRADAGDGAATTDFNLLVLVDQFEEIFTYADAGGQQAADESDAFVSLLLAARADAKSRPAEPGLHVALTMRTDFLGNCVRFFDLPEAINQAQYLTPRMKREEIERAIRGPLEIWDAGIEDSLVAELVNAAGRNADQLPQIQHALASMWKSANQVTQDHPLLDWSIADSVGALTGSIEQYARVLLANLRPSLQECVRELVVSLIRCVTSGNGWIATSHPQMLCDIEGKITCTSEELAFLIEYLGEGGCGLLVYDKPLHRKSLIRIAHETLTRNWSTLSNWVDSRQIATSDKSPVEHGAEFKLSGEVPTYLRSSWPISSYSSSNSVPQSIEASARFGMSASAIERPIWEITIPSLSPALSALIGSVVHRKYRENTLLIEEGDLGDTSYVLISGRIRSFSTQGNSREIFLGEHGPGDLVGEMSLDGGPRSESYITVEPSVCAVVSRDEMMAHLRGFPEFAGELVARTVAHARSRFITRRQATSDGVYFRLHSILMSMATTGVDGQLQITDLPNNGALANRLGLSRELVARMLQKLKQDGFVAINNGVLEIVRPLPDWI